MDNTFHTPRRILRRQPSDWQCDILICNIIIQILSIRSSLGEEKIPYREHSPYAVGRDPLK